MASLFVRNIPFSTTEAELVELFADYGEVTKAHIALDQEKGGSRGFAFIEMVDDGALRAITALDGSRIGKRTISVSLAKTREEKYATTRR